MLGKEESPLGIVIVNCNADFYLENPYDDTKEKWKRLNCGWAIISQAN